VQVAPVYEVTDPLPSARWSALVTPETARFVVVAVVKVARVAKRFVVVAAVEVEVFIVKPPMFPLDEKRLVELAVVEKMLVVVPLVVRKFVGLSTPVEGLKVSLLDETFWAWLPDAVVTQVGNIVEFVVVSSEIAVRVAEPALPVAEAAEPFMEPLMVFVTERFVVVAAVVVERFAFKKANVVEAVQTLIVLPRLRPIVLAVEPLYVPENVRVESVAVRLASETSAAPTVAQPAPPVAERVRRNWLVQVAPA
jgi:hypothetical protein